SLHDALPIYLLFFGAVEGLVPGLPLRLGHGVEHLLVRVLPFHGSPVGELLFVAEPGGDAEAVLADPLLVVLAGGVDPEGIVGGKDRLVLEALLGHAPADALLDPGLLVPQPRFRRRGVAVVPAEESGEGLGFFFSRRGRLGGRFLARLRGASRLSPAAAGGDGQGQGEQQQGSLSRHFSPVSNRTLCSRRGSRGKRFRRRNRLTALRDHL